MDVRSRRQVRIPFDERGYAAEACDGGFVQRPDTGRDPRVVRVDVQFMALGNSRAVSGEMNFLHRLVRQTREVFVCVEPVVERAHEDVVHVEQDCAAGLARERSEEIPRDARSRGAYMD